MIWLIAFSHTHNTEITQQPEHKIQHMKTKGLIREIKTLQFTDRNGNKLPFFSSNSNQGQSSSSRTSTLTHLFVSGECVKSPVELQRLPSAEADCGGRGDGDGAGDTELLLWSECKDPFDWW